MFNKANKPKRNRLFLSLLLLGYALLLLKFLVLKDLPLITVGHMRFKFGGPHHGPPNFVPFKSIYHYISGKNGWLIGALNIVGNIVLLMPVGFSLALLLPGSSWKKIGMLAAISGLVLELTELVLQVGIFDVDDLLLNATGVVLGAWCAKLLQQRAVNRGRL